MTAVVRARRLAAVREDLVHTDMTIAAIANRWSYFDPSHLGREFRRHFGASPSEYPRKLRLLMSASAAEDIAWSPSAERIAGARITEFIDWLQAAGWLEATSYESLWEWSVTRPEEFWASLVDYFGLQLTGVGPVLATREMPFAEWFPGRRLNYVDTVMSHASRRAQRSSTIRSPAGLAPGRSRGPSSLVRSPRSPTGCATEGSAKATVWWATSPTWPRQSSRSSPPRASERPGRAAVRTINPKPSSTASDSWSRWSSSWPTATASADARSTGSLPCRP